MEYVNVFTEIPDFDPIGYQKFFVEFANVDSSSYYSVLDRLEKLGPSDNLAYDIRLLFLKADGVSKTFSKNISHLDSMVQKLRNLALISEDPYLIAQSKWFSGFVRTNFSNYYNSLVNCLEAIETFEKMLPPEKLYFHYYFLSHLSFMIQDFDNSIFYAQWALDHDQGSDTASRIYQARFINTIGQSYLRKNRLDEAEKFFRMSRQNSEEYKSDIWVGINDCFIGQVELLTDKPTHAKASLLASIQKVDGIENNIAAHAKSWLGRAYWIEGNYDSALYYLTAAQEWLEQPKFIMKTQSNFYLTDLYLFKSDLYRAQGDQTQGNFYFSKFKSLSDSILTTSILSSKNIAMLRLEKDRAQLALKLTEVDKKNILFRNNIMMASFLLVIVILVGWFKMHHERLNLEKKIAVSEADKLIADKAFSVRQLGLLKKSLMEKTELLIQFEEKLKEINENVAVYEDLEKINKLKIVTEEGWKEFKDLFDSIHPGYRIRLKSKAPDITPAELRLATLIKLQYTSKEMAGVLGVSTDSIYKTRYRLRTRLNLPADKALENFLETEI